MSLVIVRGDEHEVKVAKHVDEAGQRGVYIARNELDAGKRVQATVRFLERYTGWIAGVTTFEAIESDVASTPASRGSSKHPLGPHERAEADLEDVSGRMLKHMPMHRSFRGWTRKPSQPYRPEPPELLHRRAAP
jgi:hypothetical protein